MRRERGGRGVGDVGKTKVGVEVGEDKLELTLPAEGGSRVLDQLPVRSYFG